MSRRTHAKIPSNPKTAHVRRGEATQVSMVVTSSIGWDANIVKSVGSVPFAIPTGGSRHPQNRQRYCWISHITTPPCVTFDEWHVCNGHTCCDAWPIHHRQCPICCPSCRLRWWWAWWHRVAGTGDNGSVRNSVRSNARNCNASRPQRCILRELDPAKLSPVIQRKSSFSKYPRYPRHDTPRNLAGERVCTCVKRTPRHGPTRSFHLPPILDGWCRVTLVRTELNLSKKPNCAPSEADRSKPQMRWEL